MIISIHALREEGDPAPAPPALPPHNFYPRPPRGGRLLTQIILLLSLEFLSTPSARRATYRADHRAGSKGNFYPRPPRGGRRGSSSRPRRERYFYPRPPRGGRHYKNNRCICAVAFLSTPSARRATKKPNPPTLKPTIFLSTPSARRATCCPRCPSTG